ncbi:MAG TPA: acyl-CoA dehydrogenase family protein, partial [Pseudomonadales bacterium]
MDFSLSEEQKLIKDAVEKFVRNDYDFDTRNKIIASKEGFDRKVWQQFGELGWLGVSFPEEVGGFGGGAIETNIMMEALGYGMLVEPYMATIVLGGNALVFGGTEAQKEAVLSSVIAGETLLALAYTEEESGYNLANVATKAEKSGSGFTITGEKAVVIGGAWADKVVVVARTSGAQCDEQGISLFLVDTKASGVTVNAYKTMDGARGANIKFNNVSVTADDLVGELDNGFQLLDKVIDFG